MVLSKQSVGLLELLEIFSSSLLPLLDLPLVLRPAHLCCLLLAVQLLQQHPSLLFLLSYLLQQTSLLGFVSLKLLFLQPVLLLLVLLHSLLDLHLVLLSDFELFFFLVSVFVYFFLPVIEDLVEKVDSCFLSFVPLGLLFLFFFHSLIFNESIQFLLIGSDIMSLTSDASKNPLGFFSFFFFH